MIELQKDDFVENSSKPKKVYKTLEAFIGRIVRVELDERSWGVESTSGRFFGLSLSDDEIELSLEGFDHIELDPTEDALRFSVFQEDTGKWKRVYQSKDWGED